MREKYKKSRQKVQVIERVTKKRYSVLTFVLLICILELSFSTIQNVNKSIHYAPKIKTLEKKLSEETAKNEYLKSQIKNFDSDAVLESITRNNLKMAEENEVLVLIHKPQDDINETYKSKSTKKNS